MSRLHSEPGADPCPAGGKRQDRAHGQPAATLSPPRALPRPPAPKGYGRSAPHCADSVTQEGCKTRQAQSAAAARGRRVQVPASGVQCGSISDLSLTPEAKTVTGQTPPGLQNTTCRASSSGVTHFSQLKPSGWELSPWRDRGPTAVLPRARPLLHPESGLNSFLSVKPSRRTLANHNKEPFYKF